jgi:preprotein translocase subunit SecG
MLQTIVLFAHLVVASFIIVFVLLQRGKGADAGTGFGAGASGTVFGSRGTSNFFSRTTAVLAVLFFATSLTLAYFSSQRTEPASLLEGSVMDEPGQDGPAAVPTPDEPGGLELPALDLEPGDSGDSGDSEE